MFDREDLGNVKNFYEKYGCEYTVYRESSFGDNKYVFDSPQAMLAYRVGEGVVPTTKIAGDETSYALLSKRHFGKWEPNFRLEEKFTRTFDTISGKCEMYNFRSFVGGYYGGVAVKSVENEYGTNISGHMTYDGLCTYLALASDEELVDNWKYLSKEITRNSKEDIEKASMEHVCEVRDNYLELHCVSRLLFYRAQENFSAQEVGEEARLVSSEQESFDDEMAQE